MQISNQKCKNKNIGVLEKMQENYIIMRQRKTWVKQEDNKRPRKKFIF